MRVLVQDGERLGHGGSAVRAGPIGPIAGLAGAAPRRSRRRARVGPVPALGRGRSIGFDAPRRRRQAGRAAARPVAGGVVGRRPEVRPPGAPKPPLPGGPVARRAAGARACRTGRCRPAGRDRRRRSIGCGSELNPIGGACRRRPRTTGRAGPRTACSGSPCRQHQRQRQAAAGQSAIEPIHRQVSSFLRVYCSERVMPGAGRVRHETRCVAKSTETGRSPARAGRRRTKARPPPSRPDHSRNRRPGQAGRPDGRRPDRPISRVSHRSSVDRSRPRSAPWPRRSGGRPRPS